MTTKQVKIYFILLYIINMSVVTIWNDGRHFTASFDMLLDMFL